MKKSEQQLINNIIGQLNGVNRMIGEEADCFDVLNQLKAAKSALNRVTSKFLECNLDRCLRSENKDKKEYKKLLEEITKN